VTALVRDITYSNTGGDTPTAGTRTISWALVDGDGTANGGADTTTVSSTVVVTAVNDAPAGSNATVSTTEDTAYTFGTADFAFSDVDGNSFAGVAPAHIGGCVVTRDSAAASIAQGATAAVLWACKHRRSTQLPAAQHILSPSTVCTHTFLSAAARCIIKTMPATQPQPPSHPEPTFLPVSIKRCC